MKILFDGDSITDCNRSDALMDKNFYHADHLGCGIPMLISSMLYSDKRYEEVKNFAVSGETTFDLLNRMDKLNDFIPDYYILMIGINDCWKNFEGRGTCDEDFKVNYDKILSNVTNLNKDVKIIIQTITYTIGTDSDKSFIKNVKNKNKIILELCEKYNCTVVPSNKLILNKIKETKLTDWLFADGVHYTFNTNMFLAKKIYKLIKG